MIEKRTELFIDLLDSIFKVENIYLQYYLLKNFKENADQEVRIRQMPPQMMSAISYLEFAIRKTSFVVNDANSFNKMSELLNKFKFHIADSTKANTDDFGKIGRSYIDEISNLCRKLTMDVSP